ncbi:MAG: hypothetical protein NTY71_00560 [Methanoregula sp.]|jgi:hypothetical protein|nr:hypothetical protein [Methanoregula sp.]
MARLNDDAQWIVLMGFIVSFSLFFLAIVVNQSTVVGQTTAEGVLEFPKNDIRSVREEVIACSDADMDKVLKDMASIAMDRKNAVVSFRITQAPQGLPFNKTFEIHYNNGVTAYNETATY